MGESLPFWKRIKRLFLGNRGQPPVAPATPLPPTPGGGAIHAEQPPQEVRENPPEPSPALLPAEATEEAIQSPPARTSQIRIVSTPVVDLVLGIDLGTCCSKIVIGDSGWKDCSFAVSFKNDGDHISSWLHPTRFGNETNLKMQLMNKPSNQAHGDLLACYLAEIIGCARSWFLSNCPTDYRRREILWSLNLGFPDKSVKKQTPLLAAYRQAATIAVALASQPEPPSLELAAQLRRDSSQVQPFIPSSRVQLYPEIAAQLAGYVNSPYRQHGNLLLIDVGAGTLDVSTIILHGNQENEVVSFHFCEVAPLGVMRLYEARAKALESTQKGSVKFNLDHDQYGSSPVPEDLRDLVHQTSTTMESCFHEVNAYFSKEILDTAHGCLGRFRRMQRQHHQNLNYDPWGDKLLFFLTGGGCRSRFYRNYLAKGPLEDRLIPITRWHPERAQRHANNQGLVLEPLPLPDGKVKNFPASLRSEFDRLSVAYGLAFGGQNLMDVTAATYD